LRSQARHVARRLIVLLAMFACVPVDVQGQTAADSKPKKVLALHLVRRDSPQFDDAFRAVLNEALPGQLDYYSEYIDQQRLDEERYHTALRSYLRARYVDDGIDLVIASGPSVVAFLNGDPSLFEGVPLVFTTRPGLLGGPNSTGIVSAIDLASTLSVALQAQPDTKHVYVVSGVAPFDRLYVDILKEQQAPFAGRVIFHDLAGLSLSDMERRVHDLPPHSILFFVGLSDDGAGRTFMPLDAVGPIAAAANVPMYSWHEVALGHGIVGGRLHSSVNDARETARLAVRVLRGEAPQTIPVKTIDSYAYEFDWRQLQHWSISEDRLPAGSVIRFREASFFQQYRRYVVSGGLVFALQMALIGGLLIQRLRRRRAESALRQSEARNSAILRALPDLMFVLDRNGMYVDFHARDPRDLFTEPDRFLGRTIRDIMPGPLAEMFMQALDRAHQSHEPVVVEYELSIGEPRYYEARLVPADHGRVLSIVRDVTESKRAHELNRVLAGRLIVSQEEERQRIARELHDDLSQKIALLNIEVDQMAKEMTVREHRLRLEKLSLQTGEIAGDLYDLSHELHPSRLHTLGLVESVRLLCRDVSQQRGVNVGFTHAGLPDTVDQRVSLCLYRIAQEALHNVAKHSQAPDASVRLERDGEELHLEISDSGIGFDPHRSDHRGLGLVSMRERAGVLKGRLTIDSTPGTGTRISVWVPLMLASDGQVASEPVVTTESVI
jgi:PAS domain S-box-containing protein